MWLHIPSQALGSAPARAGSNSGSISPNPAIELCVTSNRMPMRRPLSSPVWRTRPWIRRLSGTTLSPSTAARGAARWISSLPATLASPSRRRANSKGKKTRATCGRRSGALSPKSGPNGCSSKMSPTILGSDFIRSGANYDAWVTALMRDCTRRMKSARATRGRDSSCWPTPTACMSEIRPDRIALKAGMIYFVSSGRRTQFTLGKAAAVWTADVVLGARSRSTRLGRVIELPGGATSKWIHDFNPRFGEAMMGWPIDWTACGSSVTGYRPWLRRMRGELCRLGWEPDR